MGSFADFGDFVRRGGHGTIVLSLRSSDVLLEKKQASLDDYSLEFDQRLRTLAAQNWSDLTSILNRAGLEFYPSAENAEDLIDQYQVEFAVAVEALVAKGDPDVSDADVATLSNWLAQRFAAEINQQRQQQLGVTHYIWRSQDDAKVRPEHGERDDHVFAWDESDDNEFPGQDYNCRCVAEPAIVNDSIVVTDFAVSDDFNAKIGQAQANGLADAAADAAVDSAVSAYSVVRFSYLGYRRLFGIITDDEEAERLAMRQSVLRGLDAIAEMDAETLRETAEAMVDYFDAKHANLRLMDTEYRLGLVSEDHLLRAYRDVAYMDAATLMGASALATVTSKLGLNFTRFASHAALAALRAATARLDNLLLLRRATVNALVARRFAELALQGHGPQRHEGAVTRQMLIDRVLGGIDPMTGTTTDGVTGRLHRQVETATRFTNEADFVAAESYLRRSAAYRYARDEAIARVGDRRVTQFRVALPIEDVLGADFENSVEGVSSLGVASGLDGVSSVDFRGGQIIGFFRIGPNGEPTLVTMYPVGSKE